MHLSERISLMLEQVRICHKENASRWDLFVQENGGSHLQTSLWAQVKKPLGWANVRLIAENSGEIVAGMQLLIRRFPLLGAVAYIPRGPIMRDQRAQVIEALYQQLEQLIQAQRIQYLNVQPTFAGAKFVDYLRVHGFQPSQISVAPQATAWIDLNQDLDTLWGNIKKARRKAIRYASSKALAVREGCCNDIDMFYTFLAQVAQRRKGKIYPKAYYENMWRVLHQQGCLRLFILEYQGKPVTMHWVIPFGETLVSKLAAWSGEYSELHPNELLEWSVIQWAKAHGYHYYDFEGINLAAAKALLAHQPLPAALTQSATSFKLSFGGQPIIFPQAVERFSNPMLHWCYLTIFQRVAGWPWANDIINHLRTC